MAPADTVWPTTRGHVLAFWLSYDRNGLVSSSLEVTLLQSQCFEVTLDFRACAEPWPCDILRMAGRHSSRISQRTCLSCPDGCAKERLRQKQGRRWR